MDISIITKNTLKKYNNKQNENKHNAELLRTNPVTRVTVNSAPGAIFSHLMFEMNCYHFHRFSWEKIH